MAATQSVPAIPVLRTAHDAMRDGSSRSLRLEALQPHPVATIQATHLKHTWDSDLYRTERVYGLHAAWEKRMDRAVLSTVARLPGIPSSHVGIDTLLRRHDKMGFEDVLGKPEWRPTMPKLSVHEAMERKLGM